MCKCSVCERGRQFNIRLKGLLPEQREFFENMHDHMLELEFDNDYYKVVMSGEWPGSVEVLEGALERAKKKQEEREKLIE